MATPEDIQFGKTAIILGFIQSEELATCLQLHARKCHKGNDLPLCDFLVEQGYITSSQIKTIQRQTSMTARTTQRLSKEEPRFRKRELTTARRLEMKYFGRYQIIQELARGGMGRIYKAHDPQLNRNIALKVLIGSETEVEVERFLREAQTTARLSHPYIVNVHDMGVEGERPFFAMDFVVGVNLREALKQSILPFEKVIEVMCKVGEAIHYAHTEGVIHRDLKPDNIMLDEKGYPKVMDFGLVKVKGASKLSESGMLMGTLFYMPPEQADGRLKEIDVRSDIYSLGAMFYELLTGTLPFRGESFSQILEQILHKKPLPPSEVGSDIPEELDRICLKALEKEKPDRYQTAIEFVEDLVEFAQQKNISIQTAYGSSQMMTAPQSISKLVKVAIIFVLFLCTIAGVVIVQAFQKPNTTDSEKVAIAKSAKLAENTQPKTIDDKSKKIIADKSTDQKSTKVDKKIDQTPIKIVKPDKKIDQTPADKKTKIIKWNKAKSLFAKNYLKRMARWKKKEGRGLWAPLEDGEGIIGSGAGRILTSLPQSPCRIKGRLVPIGKKAREYGICIPLAKDNYITLSIQYLSSSSSIITVAYFGKDKKPGVPGERKVIKSDVYKNTDKGIDYLITLKDNKIIFQVGKKFIVEQSLAKSPQWLSLYINKSQVHFQKMLLQISKK